MITLDQVQLLEKKIEEIISIMNNLQKQNSALQEKNRELIEKNSLLMQRISSFEADQNRIEQGILNALDRLNSMENSALKVGTSATTTQNVQEVESSNKILISLNKEEVIDIDKFAYINEIKVYYFNTDFENSLDTINKCNNVNKTSIIFTKRIDKAYEFIKKVKTERVYINQKPDEEFIYNIDMNNLVFCKKIILKK